MRRARVLEGEGKYCETDICLSVGGDMSVGISEEFYEKEQRKQKGT